MSSVRVVVGLALTIVVGLC